MAGMWCPSCRSEYREGFAECADCGVALVASLPDEAATRARPRRAPSNSPADTPVELARLPALEADLLASLLHEAGLWAEVPEVWAGGELIGVRFAEGLRVLVRRADLVEAAAVLADFESAGGVNASIDVPDLEHRSTDESGWSDPSTGAVV